MNSISLLIPTHNRVEQLMTTLESVDQQKDVDPQLIEVVVVANGCTDSTIESVKARSAQCPFPIRLFDEQQLGLPSARNRAVREAKHDILAFIDDDVVLSKSYLAAMQRAYENPSADLVGGKTELLWTAVEQPEWLPDELLGLLSCKDHGNSAKEIFLQSDAIGCNFSFRKRVVEEIGDFKLGLGRTGKLLIGGEEAEFIARALRANFKMYYAPNCFLHHWVAPNRPTIKYLTGVAQGNAVGFVFSKSNFGFLRAMKALLFHTYKFIDHYSKEVLSKVRGNIKRSIYHKIKKNSQIGHLNGTILRVTGRSTLGK